MGRRPDLMAAGRCLSVVSQTDGHADTAEYVSRGYPFNGTAANFWWHLGPAGRVCRCLGERG